MTTTSESRLTEIDDQLEQMRRKIKRLEDERRELVGRAGGPPDEIRPLPGKDHLVIHQVPSGRWRIYCLPAGHTGRKPLGSTCGTYDTVEEALGFADRIEGLLETRRGGPV